VVTTLSFARARRIPGGAFAGVIAVSVCLAAGCAAHKPPQADGTLESRFITKAGPHDHPFSFDVADDPSQPAAASSRAADDGKSASTASRTPIVQFSDEVAAKMAAGPVPKNTSDVASVESSDAGLAGALQALRADPTAANECAVADSYRRLHIYDLAVDHLNAALKLDPKSAAAYDGLARTWRDWGLPEYALSDAYRAIAFAPRSAEAHNTLGTVLFALRDLKAARTQFGEARDLDPGAAYALNNLCYVSFVEGDHAQARTECTAALKTMPTLGAAKQTLDALAAAPLIVK
jgi:Flp pilus assembly protein TadD